MITIKLFRDLDSHELIKCETLESFMLNNQELFHNGYRAYKDQAADATDITEDAQAIADTVMSGCDIVVLNPAKGPETWVPLLISALVSVAVVLLTPVPKAPDNASRDQSSSTNSLGSRENRVNINGRIADTWGKVSESVPDLAQTPHFRFSGNVETEHFALIIGAGKYLQENIKDGDTPGNLIPDFKYNSWNPGKSPNNGDLPDLSIGGLIDRDLFNVTQSKELNPTELLPPNDLDNSAVAWQLTGNGSSGVIFVSDASDDFDLNDYYSIGENVSLRDMNYFTPSSGATLYASGPFNKGFDGFLEPIDVGGGGSIEYEVLSITSDTMTVSIPATAPANVLSAWAAMTAYQMVSKSFSVNSASYDFITLDEELLGREWFEEPSLTTPVTTGSFFHSPTVGRSFDGTIGPFVVPEGTDSITINVVSSSGFYKLSKNNEVSISTPIEFLLEETDAGGVPTGVSTSTVINYSTNSEKTTTQAAQTVDIENQYRFARISGVRQGVRDKSDNISNVDQAIWRDVYFISDIGNPDFGNVTLAQVAVTSNAAAQGVKARQVNLDLTRIITPYIGGGLFGHEAPIDTVAEVSIALAIDPYNGRLTLDDIDADLMLEVQEQLKEYYGNDEYVKIGYQLDSTKLRFQNTFPLFWDAVNSSAYAQNAIYKVYPDIEREQSSKQFTHRNKVVGTDKRDRRFSPKNENDGVELTYRSNNTGQFETVTLHVNGIDSVNRLKIELPGAVNNIQAETRAYRELNYLKYSRVNMEFEADGIGRLTVPGERVDNVDGTRISNRENNTNKYNIYDGIVQSIDGLTVQLSQPVTFEGGETHSIRFTNKDGGLLEAITATEGPTAYHVVLASLPSEPIYVGYKREKTTFTFASDANRSALPMIIRDIRAQSRQGLQTRKLAGINYSSRYYENDKMFSN